MKSPKDLPRTPAIYKITNTVNGKFYIGSTANMRVRIRSHRNMLRSGSHHSMSLQRAWRKYGEENFEFSIIEHVKRVDDLMDREQEHLDSAQPFGRNGYNIARNANGSFGGGKNSCMFGKKASPGANRQRRETVNMRLENGFYCDSRAMKLTWPKVNAIRAAYATGSESLEHLAVAFGVTRATTCRIANNKTWVSYLHPVPLEMARPCERCSDVGRDRLVHYVFAHPYARKAKTTDFRALLCEDCHSFVNDPELNLDHEFFAVGLRTG